MSMKSSARVRGAKGDSVGDAFSVRSKKFSHPAVAVAPMQIFCITDGRCHADGTTTVAVAAASTVSTHEGIYFTASTPVTVFTPPPPPPPPPMQLRTIQ
jgi:hypothetical protein